MPIKGLKQHLARLRKLPVEAEKAVTQALFAGAETVANEAGLSITRGAVSGKGHVASTSPNPPNADTHFLDRSIVAKRAGKLKSKVIVAAPYAEALEFDSSGRMGGARPFLRPARDKKADEIRDLVARGMNEALRRSRVSGA